jgi:hypothetical protein
MIDCANISMAMVGDQRQQNYMIRALQPPQSAFFTPSSRTQGVGHEQQRPRP